jgi:hypothetical protein
METTPGFKAKCLKEAFGLEGALREAESQVRHCDAVGLSDSAHGYRAAVALLQKQVLAATYKDGDWVTGIGPHKGTSRVWNRPGMAFEPFVRVDDYDPAHYRLATREEIDAATAF